MSDYNAKNYTEQGGEKTMIGGTLEFEDGAEVIGYPGGGEVPIATYETLGAVKPSPDMPVAEDGTITGLPLAGMEAGPGIIYNEEDNTINAIQNRAMPYMAQITEFTLENLRDGMNQLIRYMISVGLMKAPEGGE